MSRLSLKQKQILSVIFTFAVYTSIINWKAALVLVVGIGFHEYSHLLAAKKLKLNTMGFVLMPFIGGVSFVNDSYKTYWQQVFVVIMGPVGGGLLACATAGVYFLTGYSFLAAAAYWMCWINAANLAPLSIFDGGQLMTCITNSINRTLGMVLYIASTAVAIVALLWWFNPFLGALVALYGGSSAWKEYNNWKHYRAGETWLVSDDYLNPPKKLSAGKICLTVVAWATTIVVLVYVGLLLKVNSGTSLSALLN